MCPLDRGNSANSVKPHMRGWGSSLIPSTRAADEVNDPRNEGWRTVFLFQALRFAPGWETGFEQRRSYWEFDHLRNRFAIIPSIAHGPEPPTTRAARQARYKRSVS